MLATKPKFRLSSLISGDYDEKFEAYMDDQFVGRDMWRKLKVTVDRLVEVVWKTVSISERMGSFRTD